LLSLRIEKLTRLDFVPFFEEELLQKGFLEVVEQQAEAQSNDMALRFPAEDLFTGKEGSDVCSSYPVLLPFKISLIACHREHG
jgi:hypothetical protein